MGALYDELAKVFADRRGEGMTTMDMMRLPASVRTVVQLMLRNRAEMTYQALVENLDKMPGQRRVDQAQLDEVLDAMSRLDLVTQEKEKKDVTYKLNLGPSSGGRRDSAEPERTMGGARSRVDEVWDAIDSGEIDAGKPADTLLGRLLGSLSRKSGPGE